MISVFTLPNEFTVSLVMPFILLSFGIILFFCCNLLHFNSEISAPVSTIRDIGLPPVIGVQTDIKLDRVRSRLKIFNCRPVDLAGAVTRFPVRVL